MAKKYRWELLLAASMLAMLLFLAWRNHGLFPYVFADELSYNMFSRLMPLREAIVPSYLYLWLFSASSACGTGFLECVRYGNELLFVASAPFIYLTAQRVCTRPTAAMLALIALAGPVNSYTAYFMPESTYFFGFSVLAWVSLAPEASWRRLGLAGGVIIGLMSLVKVHAFFLMPAQCVFVFFACRLQGGPWLRRGAQAAALTLAAMLAVRYVLGYALAGEAGLQLFGPLYGTQAEGNAGKWASFIPYAWANLQGHLMGLALLLAFPLAVLSLVALDRTTRVAQEPKLTALQVYAFLMLAASLGMAVLYTASLYAVEGLRVHMRYYNFTFPLLFIVGAAGMHRPAKNHPRLLALLLALALAAGVAWSAAHLGGQFNLLMGDGAETAAMVRNNPYLYALAGTGIAVLAVWVVLPRLASCLFVFAFLPFFVWQTTLNVMAFQRRLAEPTIYDSAGMFARSYLSAAERAKLAITGGPIPHLMRAKFHVEAAGATMLHLDEGAPLDATLVPAYSKWLLVIGEHALPDGLAPVVKTPAYALIRLPAPARELHRINLTSTRPAMSVIDSIEGLSKAEPWGRWSDGPLVTMRLTTALPPKLVLALAVRAFGPNVGQQVVVRVGDQEQRFRAAEIEREVTLRFDTDGSQKSITILVPEPSSPTAPDGTVLDPRKLGIGLSDIAIATPAGQ